jgi:hypothetical protein
MIRRGLLSIFCLLVPCGGALWACSLCSGSPNSRASWREDVVSAKLVLFGSLSNPRINPDGSGATDLLIETVLKNDPALANRKSLTIARFMPIDPKSPPKFLVFCDVINGQIDAYRGSPAKSPAVVEYLRGVTSLPADRTKQLQYYFRFLDDTDADIAMDAYLEFAKTGDADVARVARLLDASKLRTLISHSETPPERLGLFAYLLGASGGPAEVKFLTGLLNDGGERMRPAFGGILAGLIQLEPKTGWAQTRAILGDPKRPFPQRLAAIGALRFFHSAHPDATRADVLQGLAAILPQNDLGDLAIEDLRRWQWWDLTGDIIALFGRPSHSAPLMKRAIVRYALCCPKSEAKQFVERVRSSDAEMVKDVEEGLKFEQLPTGK